MRIPNGNSCKVIAIIPTPTAKSHGQVRVAFDQLDLRILPEMSAKVPSAKTADGDGRAVLVPKNSVLNATGAMWCSSSRMAMLNGARHRQRHAKR